MKTSASLEFVKGTSNKFWTVTLDGKNVTRTWGRKGSNGQSKVVTFKTEQLATSDYLRRLRAQLRQGYLQVETITGDPRTTLVKPDGSRVREWSIRQDGHKLYVSTGAGCGSVSRQTIHCADKDAATTDYKLRVSQKLAEGFQSAPRVDSAVQAPLTPAADTDTVTNLAGKKVRRLKGDRKVVIKLSYSDFDSYVEDMVGREFYFVADQECGNDSDHELSGTGKLDDYERENVEEWISTGKGCFLASDLLNYFVSKGWLEAGTYLISVCW